MSLSEASQKYINSLKEKCQKLDMDKDILSKTGSGLSLDNLKELAASTLNSATSGLLASTGLASAEDASKLVNDMKDSVISAQASVADYAKRALSETASAAGEKFSAINNLLTNSSLSADMMQAFVCESKNCLAEYIDSAADIFSGCADFGIKLCSASSRLSSALGKYGLDSVADSMSGWVSELNTCVAEGSSKLSELQAKLDGSGICSDQRIKEVTAIFQKVLNSNSISAAEQEVLDGFFSCTSALPDPSGSTSYKTASSDMQPIKAATREAKLTDKVVSAKNTIDKVLDSANKAAGRIEEGLFKVSGFAEDIQNFISDKVTRNSLVDFSSIFSKVSDLSSNVTRLERAISKHDTKLLSSSYLKSKEKVMNIISSISQVSTPGASLMGLLSDEDRNNYDKITSSINKFSSKIYGYSGKLSSLTGELNSKVSNATSAANKLINKLNSRIKKKDLGIDNKTGSYEQSSANQPQTKWRGEVSSTVKSNQAGDQIVEGNSISEAKEFKDTAAAFNKLGKEIGHIGEQISQVTTTVSNALGVYNPEIPSIVKSVMNTISAVAPAAMTAIQNADIESYKKCLANPELLTNGGMELNNIQQALADSVSSGGMTIGTKALLNLMTSYATGEKRADEQMRSVNSSSVRQEESDRELEKDKEKYNAKVERTQRLTEAVDKQNG